MASAETVELGKAAQSAPLTATGGTKRTPQVVVASDSPMKGTEAPTCQPDTLSGEVCCLPAACTGKVIHRARPFHYCLLLLFHAGTSDTARNILKAIHDSVIFYM